MKALKNFVVLVTLLIVLATTSAWNTVAIASYNPVYLNNYLTSSLVSATESLFSKLGDIVEDELENDNLREILSGVLNIKGGKIGEIISKFSSAAENWNWKIQEGELGENHNGTTELFTQGAVTILNSSRLLKATNLAVARTIIHELVHSYLAVYFRYDAVNAGRDYPRLVKAWQMDKNPDYNELQHDEIERSFVGDIASALKEYGENSGLKIDDIVYQDLAWGGLDFNNNSQLTDEDKQRIQLRLSAEQLNRSFASQIPVGLAVLGYTK